MKKNLLVSLMIAVLTGWFIPARAQKSIVSSDGTFHDRFSKKLGNLMFSSTTLKFGHLKNNVIKNDTIRIFNAGLRTLNLTLGKVPSHLQVRLHAASLEPKQETWMTIAFDASGKNDYGFVMDRFDLLTNDSLQPKKTISVTATLEEVFLLLTSEDSANAAKARFPETVFNYGKIKTGDKIIHQFAIYNDGKKELIIHKVKVNCTCLKSSVSKSVVAYGDSSMVRIEFDSSGKDGKDSRSAVVYMNDFMKPETVLEIKGEIMR
jgi:hypothetical protein